MPSSSARPCLNSFVKALTVLAVVLLCSQAACQGYPFGEDDRYHESDYYDQPAGPMGGGSHIDGVVDVDWLTIDKVTHSGRPTLIAFLNGHDVESAPQAEWVLSSAATSLSGHLRLLLARVDLSHTDNAKYAESLGISAAPAFVLFDGSSSYTQFSSRGGTESQPPDLVAWLVEQVGHPAAIPSLLPFVDHLLASSSGAQDTAIEDAKHQAAQLTFPADAELAALYIKLMQRVTSKGVNYLRSELVRLDKLLSEAQSLTHAKQAEIVQRRAVVDLFVSRL